MPSYHLSISCDHPMLYQLLLGTHPVQFHNYYLARINNLSIIGSKDVVIKRWKRLPLASLGSALSQQAFVDRTKILTGNIARGLSWQPEVLPFFESGGIVKVSRQKKQL